MEREGISRDEAVEFIKNIDEERRAWSKHLYGIDTNDSSLYDLVFKINGISVDDVADYICELVNKGRFELDDECRKK